jgi:hypothetical protein
MGLGAHREVGIAMVAALVPMVLAVLWCTLSAGVEPFNTWAQGDCEGHADSTAKRSETGLIKKGEEVAVAAPNLLRN